MKEQVLEYKNKSYLYGIMRKRDYPTRGKSSPTYYIKIKCGGKLLTYYRYIYIKNVIGFNNIFDIKFIENEIDNYILKSRKTKLLKLKKS